MAVEGYTQKLTPAEKKLQIQQLDYILTKHNIKFLLDRMVKGPKRIYVGVLKFFGDLIECYQCRAKNQENTNVDEIAYTHRINGYDKKNLFPLAITNGIWFLWYDGMNRRLYYIKEGMVECNTTFVTINYDGSVEDFIAEFETELEDLGDACNPVVNASAPTSDEDRINFVWKQFNNNVKVTYSSTKAFVKENDSAEIIEELKIACQEVAERKQKHKCWYKNKTETTKWINSTPEFIFNHYDMFKGARSVVNNSKDFIDKNIFIPLQTNGKFANFEVSKLYMYETERSVQNSFHNTQLLVGKSNALVNVEGTSADQVQRKSRMFYISRLINILRSMAIWFNAEAGTDLYINASVTEKLKARTQALDKRLTDNQASYFVANLEKELSGKKKYVTMKLRCNSQFIEKADKLVFATFLDKKTTLDYDFGEDVKRITKDKLYQNLIRKGQ